MGRVERDPPYGTTPQTSCNDPRAVRVLQLLHLLLEHFLHLAPGDEDRRHLHAQRLARNRAGLALEGGPLERLPRPRDDAQPHPRHGLVEQFAVELLLQPPDQVVPGLDRLEQFQGQAAANRDARLAAGPRVAPGVAGDGLEPGPEALRRVVDERLHLLRQFEQDVLRQVLGIGPLEVPPAAPGVDLAAVALGEHGPGDLVRRDLPEPR